MKRESIYVSYVRDINTFYLHHGPPDGIDNMNELARNDYKWKNYPDDIPMNKDLYMKLDYDSSKERYDYIISKIASSFKNTQSNIWLEMVKVEYDIESIMYTYYAKRKYGIDNSEESLIVTNEDNEEEYYHRCILPLERIRMERMMLKN